MDVWSRGIDSTWSPLEEPFPDHEPLRLPSTTFDLHAALRRARTLRSEQQVFWDLLRGTIHSSDRPKRNLYLDIVGALEAFHSVSVGEAPIPEHQYRDAKQAALAELRSVAVDAKTVKFIKRWLPGRPFFSLPERISQLAKRVEVGGSWDISARRMSELRNEIAHGRLVHESLDLQTAHQQAFDLARRLVLHELGLPAAPP